MQFSYLIIDTAESSEKIIEQISEFDDFLCVGVCENNESGLNKILEVKPNVVFLNIPKEKKGDKSNVFSLISELNEYLDEIPYFIAISETKEFAFDAFQRGVASYLLKPLDINDLRKCLMRFLKNNKTLLTDKICLKSHGDYHFIKTTDIVYLKADNNTTDFHLKSGKIISAYKTLKYFEKLLPFYFFRIHNSYIINIESVSRINLGKSSCYLSNNEIILPFSRSYKENVDTIILKIS